MEETLKFTGAMPLPGTRSEPVGEAIWRKIRPTLLETSPGTFLFVSHDACSLLRPVLEDERVKLLNMFLTLVPGHDHETLDRGLKIFPWEKLDCVNAPGFDAILMHEGLHFVRDPEATAQTLALCLNPGGRLMITGVPNLSKKGRYLATPSGRHEESMRLGAGHSEVAEQRHHLEYVAQHRTGGLEIDDPLLVGLTLKFRAWGLNSYLLPATGPAGRRDFCDDLIVDRPEC